MFFDDKTPYVPRLALTNKTCLGVLLKIADVLDLFSIERTASAVF